MELRSSDGRAQLSLVMHGENIVQQLDIGGTLNVLDLRLEIGECQIALPDMERYLVLRGDILQELGREIGCKRK